MRVRANGPSCCRKISVRKFRASASRKLVSEPDTELDATVDAIGHKLTTNGVVFDDNQAKAFRQFLLRFPPPASAQSLLVIAASEGTVEGCTRIKLSIRFCNDSKFCHSFRNDGVTSDIFLRSPEILTMLLAVILNFIALRYTDISALNIGNVPFSSYDCFSKLRSKTLLHPFAEAGHWKTSLKTLYIESQKSMARR